MPKGPSENIVVASGCNQLTSYLIAKWWEKKSRLADQIQHVIVDAHLLSSALSIGTTTNNKKPPLEEAVLLLDSWFLLLSRQNHPESNAHNSGTG